MKTNVAQWYLAAVPILVLVLAFAIGHVSPAIYIPVWLVNSVLMLVALRSLSAGTEPAPRLYAWLVVVPWVVITIFAGMGRPPQTTQGWVTLGTEQVVRFAILIAVGVSIALALSVLAQALREAGAKIYAQLALTAALIATPLFIINMAYWGIYLPVAMARFVASGAPEARPDWYLPLKYLFFEIASAVGALYYLASLCLAVGMAQVGWLSKGGARVYVTFSIIAMVLSVLPPDVPTPVDILAYFVSIPAIGFLMFYYMALHLLRRKISRL